jgi:DnaK suppressor protein
MATTSTMSIHGRYEELASILQNHHKDELSKLRRKQSEIRKNGCDVRDLRPRSDDPPDLSDEVNISLAEMDTDRLHRIEDALKRLVSGQYGLCHDCGDEIWTKRLEALPLSTRCKDCEEKEELVALNRKRNLNGRS